MSHIPITANAVESTWSAFKYILIIGLQLDSDRGENCTLSHVGRVKANLKQTVFSVIFLSYVGCLW